MPNNIDERVVEMRIDNRQFVKGAEKTIGVLDKLKTALNFKEQTSELNSFQDTIQRVDFSGLSDAIELIGNRFTVLGIMGKRAIENITDSIYSMTVRTAKSLSIDQVYGGYSKYEQKMKSVQTMMANTASKIGTDYADQAEQLADINAQMDRLVFFTDETSYSFSGMSANMASFISAGIGIESARIDMQGVAVAAGIAGSSVEQATHAMNNLSQAMAMGSLKIQDWQSLEIAGITTDEFRKVLAETAVECGKLKKVGEDMYETIATGSQKAIRASSSGIRTLLSSGFADREVIEKTLHKYGEFSDVLNTVSDKTGVTATDLLAYLDEYENGQLDLYKVQREVADYIDDNEIPSIDALAEAFRTLSDDQLDLGKRAFKASQEYNSFTDAINATKDAVSTGWMTTFEYIFGDYMEAKKVWTAIGGELYNIFAAGAERRNAIMEIWHNEDGRDAFLESFRNIFDAFMSLIEPVKRAFNDIFNLGSVRTAAEKIITLTKRFRDFTSRLSLTEETIEKLRKIFKTFFETVSIAGKAAFNGVISFFKEAKRLATPVINAIERIFPVDKVSSFSNFIKEIIIRFGNFLNSIRLSDKALSGLENVLASILGFVRNIFVQANSGVFSKIIGFIGKVIKLGSRLVNVFFESFSEGFDGNTLLTAISNVFHEIGDTAGNIWDIVSRVFVGIFSFIGKIREAFASLGSIGEVIKKVFGFLKTVIDGITQGLSEAFGDRNLGSTIIKIAAAIGILIKAFFSGRDLVWLIQKITAPFKMLFGTIADVFYSLSTYLESMKFEKWANVFKSFGLSMLMLAGALWILSAINLDRLGLSFGYLITTMFALITAIGLLNKYGGKGRKAALLGAGLLELASAVLVLSLALALLSACDPDQLAGALGILVVTLFALVAAAALLSKYAKGGRLALIGFAFMELATALFILSAALLMLSFVKPDRLADALEILAGALIALIVAAVLLSQYAKGGTLALVGLGLMELAAGLFVLAAALTLMSVADPDKLASSLLILGLALAGIAIITKIMGPQMALIGLGLIFVATAVAILAAALMALTLVDVNALTESLIIIAGALIILAVAMAVMQTVALGVVALIAVGLAMALASVGILLFAFAMQMLEGLDLASIADGMALAGLALVILALGLAAMTVGLLGAVALVAAAGGLILMATALNLLTGINLPEMADGITLLGLSLIALGLGGVALLAAVPGMILGSIAITLFGLALYPFTMGMHQLETIDWMTILKYLAILGGTAAILALLTPVLGPLAVAVTAFGIACAVAGAGIYLAGEGMEKIANSLNAIPNLAKDSLLSIVEIMKFAVDDIKTNGELAVTELNTAATNMINTINQNGSNIVKAFSIIKDNSLQLVADSISSFEILAGNIDAGIANGIYNRLNDPIEAMHWLAYSMQTQFQNDFQMHSPSKLMEDLTAYIPLGAKAGLENTGTVAEDAMSDLGSKMLSAIYPSLEVLSMLLNEEYDFSPTITPIVDMSNVDSSAAAMRSMLNSTDMSASINTQGIDSMIANAGRITEQMNNLTGGQSVGDSFVINVYSQPGMDENELANAVMYKIQNGIVRKGAALG